MKNAIYSIFVLCAISLLISCFSTKNHGLYEVDYYYWLSGKKTPPNSAINIEGWWESSDWGETLFIQDSGNVRGKIGYYDCEGKISGDMIYLLVSETGTESSGGNVFRMLGKVAKGDRYYTLIMKKIDNSILTGTYNYCKLTNDENDGTKILLKRKDK